MHGTLYSARRSDAEFLRHSNGSCSFRDVVELIDRQLGDGLRATNPATRWIRRGRLSPTFRPPSPPLPEPVSSRTLLFANSSRD